ncbi:hypothetical protein C7999DRAFT_14936 [Corynascus novoguineensis]|uniref:gamma-glutamylcyclotransferase n=1 Tax=Corynascus novoguineensis TaxID=1126955 RepID=A0AAN7HNA7_9PEZI|nr:hypothetical protein C7999DRAFT_14936 [Corynascus novoguineensis]
MTGSTLYFAFGSNLWKHQMSLRCPSSPYVGLGRLRGYEWFINARGYANIAQAATKTPNRNLNQDSKPSEPEVWGLVYALSAADEAQLDVNEGVPYAYEKRMLPVEFWTAPTMSTSPSSPSPEAETDLQAAGIKGRGRGEETLMLVYIDFRHSAGGHPPRAEYVHRMNMGIRDALAEGVPAPYVRRVLREYIPSDEEEEEEEEEGGWSERKAVALEQARGFVDGRDVVDRRRATRVPAAAAATPVGSGVVSSVEGETGMDEAEEEELPERASGVCYLKHFGF